jgi:hypothetical protein
MSLLEDIVCDLAARGVVSAIEGEDGEDLLGPLVDVLTLQSDGRADVARPAALLPSGGEATSSEASPTAEPRSLNACSEDLSAPLCESPVPNATSLDEALMQEINRSPEPRAAAQPSELPVTEPTLIDHTLYGAREESIPIEEASVAIRETKTPFTAVTSEEPIAGLPAKRRAWPMVAFMAVTALVAWAVMHFSAMPGTKRLEKAPPPAEAIAVETTSADVTYAPARPDAILASGQGLLDVTATGDAVILVDGKERARGTMSLPLAAGAHDIQTSNAGAERTKAVEVRSGQVARVRF